MSGPANGVRSSGKDLCFGFTRFHHKNYKFVWNVAAISGDSKNEKFATLVLLLFILNRLLLLVVSISRSLTLKKYFMIVNIYNFLRAFHTFLGEIGGHVCRHSVVKQRAYCRLVTGIDGEETIKTLCSVMRKPSSDS